MRKHIIITLFLFVVTAYVTVVYFKNLIPPGTHTSRVMAAIPDNAALIFEFNNDTSFYDIFKDNKLFAAVAGKQQLGQLDTLRQQVLQNQLLAPYFNGQKMYLSVHPAQTTPLEFLFTSTAATGFGPAVMDQLAKQPNSGLVITPFTLAGKQGYNIYISVLKRRFYVINTGGNIFSGSFSKELMGQTVAFKIRKNKPAFVLLPDQQNANSLANVYVNYSQLNPLFARFLKNKTNGIFKSFEMLPGFAALSLNYKTDALMFSGSTAILLNQAAGYLNLFNGQHPVVNHLKDIFPSTTAYETNFSISDPLKFRVNLMQWITAAGLKNEKEQLFTKIQAETGIDLQTRFHTLLGNEFAAVTTRYFENLAIISVKDGSKMNLLLMSVSKIISENMGQFNYEKIPFFLLGDAFGIFRHPYYLIIDNYLILANSSEELRSYYDSYLNRKFLSKNEQYQQFDNLLSAQSNITLLLIFKNSGPLFKRDMNDDAFTAFDKTEPGWKNFYGASLQFSAADKIFYTNFCLKLITETIDFKSQSTPHNQ